MLSPFLYVHNLYSNMVDKFSRHASVSWSFYMQNNNGNLVVVKSGPHVRTDTVKTLLNEDEDDDLFVDGEMFVQKLCIGKQVRTFTKLLSKQTKRQVIAKDAFFVHVLEHLLRALQGVLYTRTGPTCKIAVIQMVVSLTVDYKTSNYIETNIASLDNSITPNVKNSQVHGLDMDGINYQASVLDRDEQPQVNDTFCVMSRPGSCPSLIQIKDVSGCLSGLSESKSFQYPTRNKAALSIIPLMKMTSWRQMELKRFLTFSKNLLCRTGLVVLRRRQGFRVCYSL